MKCKMRWLFPLVIFLGLAPQVFSQTLNITGRVKNAVTGEVLNGVSVVAKNTAQNTVTDAEGKFSMSVPVNTQLQFTYVGMNLQSYRVTRAGNIEISLEPTTNKLDEVVVIGYGTQKITKVSGAISAVKSADIEKLRPVRVEDALQGRTSGVNVIQGGSPGSAPTITIRGIPSYTGNGPLVVIDGINQTQADLNAINPADIESINLLKDAATAAIYGVSGGNGVIVVTTKTGRKNQKADISLNTNYGIQEVIRTIPVLNASEYGAMVNEGSVTAGGNIIFPDLSVLGAGTDWQNEIFEKAPLQLYNLGARGGSDKITYFLSGGYMSQGGIVGGYDRSRFNRINFSSNLSFDLTSRLKFILNANYQNLSSKGVQENSFNSIIGSALNYDPTVPVLNNVPNTVGKYGFSNLLLSEVFNPLTKLDNTFNKNSGNKFYGKFEFQYDVIKDLKLTSRFGYTKYDGNAKSFNPLVFWGLNNVDNSMNADGSTVTGKHNSVSHEKATFNNFNFETFANYNFNITADHQFETTLGFALGKNSGHTAGASRQDVPYNSWEFADYNAATGNNTATNTEAVKGYYYEYFKRNLSYFGRINYDYQDKYLASFTARRDGSTAFGKDNKFGLFSSGSLGWVISKEAFFRPGIINFLKLRGSYGALGNDNTNPQFAFIQTDYLASLYGSGNSIGYTFGNAFNSGATLGSLSNDQLSWEKQLQANVGVEMNFLRNKFSLTADYYQKDVKGLLFKPNPSLYLGTIPPPSTNIGSTKTNGIDLLLSFNDRLFNKIRLNTSIAFTTVKSKVTATNEDGSAWIFDGGYFNGQSQTVTVFAKGYSPVFFYGYQTAGLFQSAEEVTKWASQAGAQPGDIKFVDVNKDGIITADDKTQIGNPFPKFTVGWNLNLEYRGFDFTAFTYGSYGNDIYRAYERNANYTNKFKAVVNRWTGPGSTNDARYPRYSFTDPNNNARVSERFVEDGSFIKVKNLVLGYNIPASAAKWFRSIRVYAQVRNAFTFTKYTGYDPEVTGGGLLSTGVDRGSYPQSRTYSLGFDIKF